VFRVVPRAARLLIVFVPLFVFLWQVVDPRLIYHHQCPIFRTDWAFFHEHLGKPGGLVEYLGSLMSQAFVCPWAGAAVIAGAILSVCLAGGAWLSAVAGRGASWLALLAAAPLVALHTMYHFPLHVALALAVALAVAAGYARWPARAFAARWAGFAALAAGVYYLAGAPALLLGLLCGLREVLVARRWVLGLAIMATAGAVPWLASIWWDLLSLSSAYTLGLSFPLELDWPAPSVALYALLPVAAVGLALVPPVRALARACWRWAMRKLAPALPARKGKNSRAHQPLPASPAPPAPGMPDPGPTSRRASGWPRAWAAGRWLAATLVVSAAWVAWAWASVDTNSRSTLRIDYLASRKDWQGVLREARRLPLAHVTRFIIHDVDLALFHTGRLGEDMFSFPQMRGMPGLTLCEPGTTTADAWRSAKVSELMLELGHVNEAEHMANEAIEMLGARPNLLRTLFLVYVLKGQPVAARTYLTAMGTHLLHAREAQRYAALLQQDPSLDTLEDVRQIRRRMPTADGPPKQTMEQMLQLLLRSDPKNRMAFEYLMAHYLLEGRVDGVARNIARLKDFGRQDIPRHYEEAILMLAYQLRLAGRNQAIPLGDLQLRPGAQRRLEAFLKTMAKFGKDRKAAQADLNDAHDGREGSYYIYYTYGKTMGGLR
jgi:hypothetical protein